MTDRSVQNENRLAEQADRRFQFTVASARLEVVFGPIISQGSASAAALGVFRWLQVAHLRCFLRCFLFRWHFRFLSLLFVLFKTLSALAFSYHHSCHLRFERRSWQWDDARIRVSV